MSSGGSLDSQFLNTAGTLSFTLLGESVTYYQPNVPGTTPTTTAITAVRVPTPDLFEPEESEQTGWIVLASDISLPKEGDRITDDGSDVWNVVKTSPQNGGVFFLTCIKARAY